MVDCIERMGIGEIQQRLFRECIYMDALDDRDRNVNKDDPYEDVGDSTKITNSQFLLSTIRWIL